jgi:hypothetical protein
LNLTRYKLFPLQSLLLMQMQMMHADLLHLLLPLLTNTHQLHLVLLLPLHAHRLHIPLLLLLWPAAVDGWSGGLAILLQGPNHPAACRAAQLSPGCVCCCLRGALGVLRSPAVRVFAAAAACCC